MDATLTCQCGKTVPVRFTDAGREITCSCQKTIVVPKLSELRAMGGITKEKRTHEELTPEQVKGRKMLAIVSGLMGLYEVFGLFIFIYPVEVLKHFQSAVVSPHQTKALITSLIAFIVLSFFACMGSLLARFLLVIRALVGLVLMIYVNYGGDKYYLIDVIVVLAYVFALLRIRV